MNEFNPQYGAWSCHVYVSLVFERTKISNVLLFKIKIMSWFALSARWGPSYE